MNIYRLYLIKKINNLNIKDNYRSAYCPIIIHKANKLNFDTKKLELEFIDANCFEIFNILFKNLVLLLEFG